MDTVSFIHGKVQISNEGFFDVVAHTISNLLGSKVNLQLVSVKIDPATQDGKRSAIHGLKIGASLVNYLNKLKADKNNNKNSSSFPVQFCVAQDFGTPGAILVDSEVAREFFLESITLQLPESDSEIQFPTKSWINQSKLYPGPRIFFPNKAYLPSETPEGLAKLRKEELVYLRGDGTGERRSGERIYDYDFYNNLGNPDLDASLARPVLGGSAQLPYPRRCRTGGKPTKAANKKAWMTDEEFARQRLAGMNPLTIERLKVFPPESCLDSSVYGLEKSRITADHLEGRLEGLTVEEAMDEKRLYILDYHDSYITPYIARINETEGKAYASRTLFFLTKAGLLLPVVIELILPPNKASATSGGGEAAWTSRVFCPPAPGKIDWLWQLAKVHVSIVDACYQHLSCHWLRTHACMEPFIIATRRQLSAMHPLSMLLSPHFKDTMNANTAARESFLNSAGRIERCFVTGKYSNEVTSIDYKRWRFDEQAIPKDLIKRGMAEPDEAAEHGLRLHIQDYPYAQDGLDLWAAIKGWVEEYISIYYESDGAVTTDEELQAWWWEVRQVGHGDHKDAPWWAAMTTVAALVEVVVTLLWMATGLHAVANFGQYPFAGFIPSNPAMGRRLIPEAESPELRQLLADPPAFFLASLSTQRQATTQMGTFETTSQHMSEETYLGGDGDEPPSCDDRVVAAHERLHAAVAAAHDRILARTTAASPHRAGLSQMPFTLLLPYSSAGLTGRGVPNSIST